MIFYFTGTGNSNRADPEMDGIVQHIIDSDTGRFDEIKGIFPRKAIQIENEKPVWQIPQCEFISAVCTGARNKRLIMADRRLKTVDM